MHYLLDPAMRRANPDMFKGLQIHEIHPVKFGGSPTDLLNKVFLTPEEHRLYNTFWFKLQLNKMKKSIEKIIERLDRNVATDEVFYFALLKKINFSIDKEFLEFIKSYNGAEGFLGENNYIAFWNVEQLISLNPYYEDNKECEELFFFATDGSNIGYAFDKKNGYIIAIDFLDISRVKPDIVADTFEAFLDNLSNS